MADFCAREAAHFRIARHVFLIIPARNISAGGEPSRPCATQKESSSSTLVQELSKGTEQYKSSTFVIVSQACYYLCKLVEKLPRGESVQIRNARWSSPSWFCHTASFLRIGTRFIYLQRHRCQTFSHFKFGNLENQCLLNALTDAEYNHEIHTSELRSEAQRRREHRSYEHFPSRSDNKAWKWVLIVSTKLPLAPLVGGTKPPLYELRADSFKAAFLSNPASFTSFLLFQTLTTKSSQISPLSYPLCNTESRQPIQCLKFIAPVHNIVYAQRLTMSQQTLNRIQQNILRLIQHCYFPQHLRKESLQACVGAQTRERQGMQFCLRIPQCVNL